MSKYISKFSGYEVDAYISKIINGEVVLENTINEIEENKLNPISSDTLYNKFKDINDIFNIINKDIDIFKKQLDEILKGNVGSLSDIIGVDDNGDVYIKQNGDKPRNFYTRGTISFGGSTDNDTEPTIIANLSDLLDVSLKDITNGQSLVYENGYWVNKEIKTGLTDEEINNMLNPINTKITNLENKVNPLEARIAFFENIIGVDEITGDVYIKKNGDLPRNFYNHGTISFGGLSINEDVSVVNKISDLSDVFINNISANQILVWDTTILNDSGSYGAWVNKDLEQGLNTEELDIYLRNNEYVQKPYVDNRIIDLINGAPAAYDTLKEIADVLSSNVNSIGDIMLTLSKKADKGTTLADYGITDALDNTTKYALSDSVGGNALNALKLGGQGPLYYATAVGLTEVSDRVKTLEDVIGIDKNGDVYIKDNNGNPRNFYTYGTISFNGLDIGSGDSPSTGNITISLNGEEFTSTNGYIELPSYPTALKNPYALTINGHTYDGSEAVNITIEAGISSVDWDDILNKPIFATVATSGKYSDLSGTPSSLPASDVYAWAKKSSLAASDVPSLDWSKITSGKPTTLSGYGITDAVVGNKGNDYTSFRYNGFYIVIYGDSDWRLTNSGWQTEYKILHSNNYADYALPLSGGTLHKSNDNTPLVIKGTTAGAWIAYRDSDSVFLGSIGVQSDKKAYFYETSLGSVELLHSSNYSSYALPKSGGTITGGLTISSGNLLVEKGDTITNKLYPIADNAYTLGQNSRRWSDVRTVLINGGTPIHSGNIGSYNAGSATKLQTARTIWGQSFDGSGDVSGKLTGASYIETLEYGVGNASFALGSSYSGLLLSTPSGSIYCRVGNSNALTVKDNGNILVGATSDNGARLQVSGNLTITGTVAFASDIRYKDVIENTTIDLETIANAPLFNYKWNDRDDKKIHLGTSAQYWYKTAFKNAVAATTDEKLWTMGYAEIALGNTITLAKELIPIKKEVNKIKVLEERVKKLENILIVNNIMFD